jgi:hypothetical protein
MTLPSFRTALLCVKDFDVADSLRAHLLAWGLERVETAESPSCGGIVSSSAYELIVVDLDSIADAPSAEISGIRASYPCAKILAFGKTCTRGAAAEAILRGADLFIELPAEWSSFKTELNRLAFQDQFAAACRAQVGNRSLRSVLEYARAEMAAEALKRAQGSVRGAARLLSVDRAYVRRLRALRSRRDGRS